MLAVPPIGASGVVSVLIASTPGAISGTHPIPRMKPALVSKRQDSFFFGGGGCDFQGSVMTTTETDLPDVGWKAGGAGDSGSIITASTSERGWVRASQLAAAVSRSRVPSNFP